MFKTDQLSCLLSVMPFKLQLRFIFCRYEWDNKLTRVNV